MDNQLENLYVLARRAKDSNDSKNAENYYQQILLQNPNDWEAAFYTLYFSTMNCTLAQMEGKLSNFSSSFALILKLCKSLPEKKDIYSEISNCVTALLSMYYSNYLSRARSYSDPATALQKINSGLLSVAECAYSVGSGFETVGEKEYAIIMYKYAIEKTNQDDLANNSYRKLSLSRLEKLDPEYIPPEIERKSLAGCYVATCVYGSYDCPQVWTLRRYRDNTLSETWYGRVFIRLYYAVSPTIVKLFGKTEWFKKMWKGKLDKMVARLNSEGVEDTPYEDKTW